ncbi:holo-[acyl-carrier-protein] synthase [Candidatus Aerophobetes bacterium]|uniref:Holo-[acyl-carrier-protein] synthase n=1 Tax=Aerophobetes bacterium TaxID=2030807 RepID=A0A497E4Y9_UNCAE|nr:MAG: holo-[acyl-carrier-protein] synthase [Candidatus Aerophobetes bacterium]
MVKGIGIDIVKIERIKKATERWKGRFEKKILTLREIECGLGKRDRFAYVAGRFAAKEAVRKALGRAINWQDMEILPEKNGKPSVSFSGSTRRIISEEGVRCVLITLSHNGDYAIAQAVAIGD